MIAVIPYRLPKHGSDELRFAIRSLVKHFRPLEDIIIVGHPPLWYTGKYIPMTDVPGRKEFSIYRKLMACGISAQVLYTNDDYYALEDFDETLPAYYWGTCGSKRPADRVYRRLYGNCPGEWLNFDIHTPMVIDTSRFTDWPIDRPIKTAYAYAAGLIGVALPDCKIRGNPEVEDIMEMIQDRPFFSTSDNAGRPGVSAVLNALYPEKSPYERD